MSVKYKIIIECPIERRHITNGEIVIHQNAPAKIFCDVIDDNTKANSSFKEINDIIKEGKRLIRKNKRFKSKTKTRTQTKYQPFKHIKSSNHARKQSGFNP